MALPCPPIQPICVDDVTKNLAKDFLENLTEAVIEANVSMVKLIATGWLYVPTAKVGDAETGRAFGTVAEIRGSTAWLVAAIAVAALLVSAGKLALNRDAREAAAVGKNLGWLVVLTGGGIPFIVLLVEIGDEYSKWIVNRSTGGNFGARVTVIANLTNLTGIGVFLTLGMALLMFAATFAQILMMIGRGVGLIMLTGLLPVAAAAGISGGGRQMRERYLSWLLAFVLYKPAAATVYATGFFIIGTAKDFFAVLTGMVAFCMAVVALPALMRLIAPAVSAVSSGGGGAGAAAVSAGAQVASGAMQLSQAKTSGGGGDGGESGGGAPTGSGSAPVPATPAPGAGGGGAPSGGAAGGGATPAGSTGAGTAGAGTGGGAAGGVAGGVSGAGSTAAGAGASGAAAGAGPAAAGVMVAKGAMDAGKGAVTQAGGAGATGATGDGQ